MALTWPGTLGFQDAKVPSASCALRSLPKGRLLQPEANKGPTLTIPGVIVCVFFIEQTTSREKRVLLLVKDKFSAR